MIIFVAGGMTFSEMREAYDLSSSLGKDIYIGSTHTFTPCQFIDDLKGIEKSAKPFKTFQAYYDDKYTTNVLPPQEPVLDVSHSSQQEHGKPSKALPVPSPGLFSSPKEEGKKKKKKLFPF